MNPDIMNIRLLLSFLFLFVVTSCSSDKRIPVTEKSLESSAPGTHSATLIDESYPDEIGWRVISAPIEKDEATGVAKFGFSLTENPLSTNSFRTAYCPIDLAQAPNVLEIPGKTNGYFVRIIRRWETLPGSDQKIPLYFVHLPDVKAFVSAIKETNRTHEAQSEKENSGSVSPKAKASEKDDLSANISAENSITETPRRNMISSEDAIPANYKSVPVAPESLSKQSPLGSSAGDKSSKIVLSPQAEDLETFITNVENFVKSLPEKTNSPLGNIEEARESLKTEQVEVSDDTVNLPENPKTLAKNPKTEAKTREPEPAEIKNEPSLPAVIGRPKEDVVVPGTWGSSFAKTDKPDTSEKTESAEKDNDATSIRQLKSSEFTAVEDKTETRTTASNSSPKTSTPQVSARILAIHLDSLMGRYRPAYSIALTDFTSRQGKIVGVKETEKKTYVYVNMDCAKIETKQTSPYSILVTLKQKKGDRKQVVQKFPLVFKHPVKASKLKFQHADDSTLLFSSLFFLADESLGIKDGIMARHEGRIPDLAGTVSGYKEPLKTLHSPRGASMQSKKVSPGKNNVENMARL